jgi:hypothetical protein
MGISISYVKALNFIYPTDNITENYHVSCDGFCGTQVSYNSTYFEWETDIEGYNYSTLYFCDTPQPDCFNKAGDDIIVYGNSTYVNDSYIKGFPYPYFILEDENGTDIYYSAYPNYPIDFNSTPQLMINISEYGSCPENMVENYPNVDNIGYDELSNTFNETLGGLIMQDYYVGYSNASYCEVYVESGAGLDSPLVYNGSVPYNFTANISEQDFIDSGWNIFDEGGYFYKPHCYDSDGYCTIGSSEYIYYFINATVPINETECIENWLPYYSECVNSSESLYYIDDNACGTVDDLPDDNGSIIVCSCNWPQAIMPCVDGVRMIAYNNPDNCDYSSMPSDNGTNEYCSLTTPDSKTMPDLIILIILGFFIIVCLICALMIHPIFFAMNALCFALMLTTFIYYKYPAVTYYISIFMILVFVVMSIIIKKDR